MFRKAMQLLTLFVFLASFSVFGLSQTDDLNGTPLVHLNITKGDGTSAYFQSPKDLRDSYGGSVERQYRLIDLNRGETWRLNMENRNKSLRLKVCVAVDGRHVNGKGEVNGDLTDPFTWSSAGCFVVRDKYSVTGWMTGTTVEEFKIKYEENSVAVKKFNDRGGLRTIAISIFPEVLPETELEDLSGSKGMGEAHSRGIGTGAGRVSQQKVTTVAGVKWSSRATAVIILQYDTAQNLRDMGYFIPPAKKQAANRMIQ